MKLNALFTFLTLFLLASCGSTEKAEAQTSDKKSKVSSSVGKSCLAKNAMNPESLLTVEEIAAIAQVAQNELSLKELPESFKKSKYYKDSEMRYVTYKLPSDRKIEIKVRQYHGSPCQ